tara:strand:+ start:399 stop:1070 length:672 start_codon:yes stop_codon:yes gene_type:complete
LKNLTLIIPAKNEAESLPKFLEELTNLEAKKLVILEKNDIETINSIKDYRNIKIIYQISKGYGNAIIEGINNSETEYSCIINADGSMDPKYLREMLTECSSNNFVFASRYEKPNGGSEDDTIITYIGNKIFSLLGNLLFNLNISDILFTYILGKTNSFKSLNLKNKDFRLCVELPIKAKKMNFKYKIIPSFERSRYGGKKKVNAIVDGFLILMEILSFVGKKN